MGLLSRDRQGISPHTRNYHWPCMPEEGWRGAGDGLRSHLPVYPLGTRIVGAGTLSACHFGSVMTPVCKGIKDSCWRGSADIDVDWNDSTSSNFFVICVDIGTGVSLCSCMY